MLNLNTRFVHMVPMAVNWTSNAILQYLQGSNASVILHSMHNLVVTNSEQFIASSTNTFWMQFFVLIGLSMIPTSAIVFVVKERESNCKHQQFVAGVSLFSYWSSNFCWD